MMKFLWPVLLAVAGAAFLVEEIQHRQDYQAFQAHGESAIVEPIKAYTETTRKKKWTGQVTGVSYSADLTFRTKSGERVTAPSQTLPPGILEAFRSGAKVSIQYLPENPTTIRFADQVYYSDNRLAAFALMLGGMIWFFLVWRARED